MSPHDKALLAGFGLVVAGLVASAFGVPGGQLALLFGIGVVWWSL